jgi:hypothetical protein
VQKSISKTFCSGLIGGTGTKKMPNVFVREVIPPARRNRKGSPHTVKNGEESRNKPHLQARWSTYHLGHHARSE